MSDAFNPISPRVGQRVRVDLSGMQLPHRTVEHGVVPVGTVTHVDPATRRLTIRLDISIDGYNLVTADPGRVLAIS